jgi:hypothetical protein
LVSPAVGVPSYWPGKAMIYSLGGDLFDAVSRWSSYSLSAAVRPRCPTQKKVCHKLQRPHIDVAGSIAQQRIKVQEHSGIFMPLIREDDRAIDLQPPSTGTQPQVSVA